MSRVRVITGIVPVRFFKLPTSGAQVAYVVTRKKACRSCRKMEDLAGRDHCAGKKRIGLRKSGLQGTYRNVEELTGTYRNVQERTGTYRSLKVDVVDGGRPEEVMLKPNHCRDGG